VEGLEGLLHTNYRVQLHPYSERNLQGLQRPLGSY
jgi:hypothetical protein